MSRRPSAATAIALLALVVALGGTAVAEPVVNAAARIVTGKTVKNSSLTGKDVKDKSLTGKDVKDQSLTGKDVKNLSLTPSDFRGSVRGATGATGATGPSGPRGVSGVTTVTRLEVATGSEDADLAIDPVLISEAGTFAKSSATSRIKLTWNGRIHGEGSAGWFCDFQVRIDGAAPSGEGARGVVFANGDPERDVSVSVTAFFGSLAAGTHAVDVYVRADPATTDRCSSAEGGFEDEIYVEEMPG